MLFSARSFPLLATLLAAVTLMLLAPDAGAQDDAATQTARQKFMEGVKLYDQRKYEEASETFLQAYELKQHPAVLLNLAQSELRAGKTVAAAEHFSKYLRENTEASEGEKQEAELGFAAAKSKVGELQIQVDADGAEVLVDGTSKGTSPLGAPVYVAPGKYVVDARKDGKSATANITAQAGAAQTVKLSFAEPAAAAAAAPVAETEEAEPDKDEPEHDAEVSTKGRKPFFKWWVKTPLAMVMSGIAVASGVGAVVMGLSAKSNYDQADDIGNQIRKAAADDNIPKDENGEYLACSPDVINQHVSSPDRRSVYFQACDSGLKKTETADTQKVLTWIFGGIAGAGIVGTAVYYFVAPSAKESDASVRVMPLASPGLTGLAVSGRF